MSNIITFQPKNELTAKENLTEFIRFAKEDLSYRPLDDWDWQQPVWGSVGGFVKHGVKATVKTMHKLKPDQLMSSGFSEFVKAYIRYKQTFDHSKQIGVWMLPFKALEPALLQVKGCDDVSLIDITVLDEAVVKIRKQTNVDTVRYDTGRRLERIASFLVEKQLVAATFNWKSPFSPVSRYSNRVDRAAKAQKSAKMPDETALTYLAEIFANDFVEPRDRFVSSSVALLMCAPSRGSELFDLSIHCIHEEPSGEIGLRWHAKKQGGHDIKYIPTSMKDVAVEAVRRLTELSKGGRELAKWLEDNDGKFYRQGILNRIPDDKPLTQPELLYAIGFKPDGSMAKRKKGVAEIIRQGLRDEEWLYLKAKKTRTVTLADLDVVSKKRLPKDFPWINKEIGLKWSDALYCMRKNETHRVAFRPYELWMPDISVLINDLSEGKSIFKRHGYKMPDGSNCRITTHQFRHYLNTLAHRGDLGELDIAKWSGRANIHQNNVYNHMRDDEYLEKITTSKCMVAIGKPLEKIKLKSPNLPVTAGDLDAIVGENDRIAHVTEYGFCVHDFAISPCQRCMDCLNCSEQVCVKGDDEKLARLIDQRDHLKEQLENARKASNEGVFGADRWADHQQQTIDRITELIDIMSAEDILDGSIVRLRNDLEDSPVKRTLNAIQSDPEPRDLPDGISLAQIRGLLEH